MRLPGVDATAGSQEKKNRKRTNSALAVVGRITQRNGHGPDKPLKVKISVRNIPAYRDPAAILIDQLRPIGIEGELETIETANWIPKLIRVIVINHEECREINELGRNR
jgi:hypothetical protein